MSAMSLLLGIVGTLSGLAALWLSYKNYQWIKNQKVIDIQLELRKSVITAHELAHEVQRTIRAAHGSRISLLAASGAFNSGARVAMEQRVARDNGVIDEIIGSLPARDATFDGDSIEQIADVSRNVHDAHTRLTALKAEYDGEIHSDELAADRRAHAQRFP